MTLVFIPEAESCSNSRGQRLLKGDVEHDISSLKACRSNAGGVGSCGHGCRLQCRGQLKRYKAHWFSMEEGWIRAHIFEVAMLAT